jgi:hypothetical protein
MALEITAAATSREAAIAFLQAVNIATVDEAGNIIPIAEVQIHPSRPEETITIVKTPAVVDPETLEIISPAEIVAGWHYNLRFYGTSEATLRKPEPQGGWPDDADIFDRTYINELVAGRTGQIPNWVASAEDPIPPGYEANGCRAFDPSLVATRANVWA